MKTLLTLFLTCLVMMGFSQEIAETVKDKTVLEYLLGPMDVNMFIAAFIVAIVGATITILISIGFRDKYKTHTPIKFSHSFFWRDNWQRISAVVLMLICSIRFYPEIFGTPISMWLSLILGLGFDSLVYIFKKLTKKTKASWILNAKREKKETDNE